MDIFRIISAMIKLAAYFVMVKVLILQNIRSCCAAGIFYGDLGFILLYWTADSECVG